MSAEAEPLVSFDRLEELDSFQQLVERHHQEDDLAVGGLWGASQALVFAGLCARAQGPWLVVLSSEAEAEQFVDDLATFDTEATLFPARDAAAGTGASVADMESVRRRLLVAQRLVGPPERRPRLVVASLLSLLQPIPSPESLEGDYLHVQVGGRLDTEGLLERLVASGYTRQPLAESPGELSLRGDILDVFPFAAELPLRVELFDDEVESLRTFDPESQRSLESMPRAAICLVSDAGGVEDGKGIQPARTLPSTTVCVSIEPLRLEEQTEGMRVRSTAHAHALRELGTFIRQRRRLALQSLPCRDLDFEVRSVQALGVGIRMAGEALRGATMDGSRALVLCESEVEEERFRGLIEEQAPDLDLRTRVGSLSKGFRIPRAGLVVVNHRELVGLSSARRTQAKKPQHRARALQSFFELRVGDLVVHAVHGLARFIGLERMQRNGGEEDHLHLIFEGEVSLFVPAARIDLVQRYIGSGSSAPPLDKIGGKTFKRRKEKVERALVDLAADLLEVQALRETKRRDPWQAEPELERQLVASFPWSDTPDQEVAYKEITTDLAAPRPMDRLLCGDVGFGKTELALRAAFRVVSGGGQVAILVPTTVLAQQHYATFCERLAEFPVEVAVLSRHVTGKAAKATLQAVNEGQVDILIGTHRLLSKDVDFKRMGLVIVDEEQRFGVKHKEHFKRLRASVDLLTLSATPIPRTLHMSLSGLRDISALTTPPAGRQDIDTVLAASQDRELVREILLREKARGGQVFFLHNRVQSIQSVATELRQLVPECQYLVGHGQMSGGELSRVMRAFIAGEADVLVATTIIENGIDIPSAGTIVIDRADTFGLSELHQLRGRVGRGRHKSYCYLLVDETRPLSGVARDRLKALEELSHLGAGFGISMKDLEIRGAGNLLGPEQSGHITAVGYDMYCRLLRQTVERMQRSGIEAVRSGAAAELPGATRLEDAEAVELELGIDAYFPESFIPTADARLELLRVLDAIRDAGEAREIEEMLRDRYGRLPAEAQSLVRQFALRARLLTLGIRRLAWREGWYLIEYTDRIALEGVLAPHGVELRPMDAGRARLTIPPEQRGPAQGLAWFEGLLQEGSDASKMTPLHEDS